MVEISGGIHGGVSRVWCCKLIPKLRLVRAKRDGHLEEGEVVVLLESIANDTRKEVVDANVGKKVRRDAAMLNRQKTKLVSALIAQGLTSARDLDSCLPARLLYCK